MPGAAYILFANTMTARKNIKNISIKFDSYVTITYLSGKKLIIIKKKKHHAYNENVKTRNNGKLF